MASPFHPFKPYLKSNEFCLSRQAEHLHAIRVLPFDDEFREGIDFFASHEKSWQGVAKRGSDDEFGGRNAWSNRSQPRAE